MFRYLSLIWNSDRPDQSASAQFLSTRLKESDSSYQLAFEGNGLRVFCAPNTVGLRVQTLSLNAGVILGSVYLKNGALEDDTPARQASFSDQATAELIKSEGKVLFERYWGNYVTFLQCSPTGSKHVLKDPTGTLPCFRTSWNDISVIFSDLQACLSLNVFRFHVNWTYVLERVGSGGYNTSCQPLEEVSEIFRGQRLTWRRDADHPAREMCWYPTAFCREDRVIDDADIAVRHLRAAVRSATATLAAEHHSVLVRLSGGLDSSIVCGCIANHRQTRLCSYTYFVDGGKSDERRWARMAADHSRSEHVEISINPSRIDLRPMLRIGPSVTPVWAFAFLERDSIERELSNHFSYSAVINGEGGDSGFGSESVQLAVDDFLRIRGFSRDAITLAARVALQTNSLAWNVLAAAIRRRMFGSSMREFRDRLMLGANLVSSTHRGSGLDTQGYPHPWFESWSDTPWNAIGLVGDLTNTPQFYNPFISSSIDAPLVVSPLYSQPVIEACLRIPLYLHFLAGNDRGLARQAFFQEVPQPILQRKWKDRAPGAFEGLVRYNRSFLSEVISGGALCREGVLDRKAVQDTLTGNITRQQCYAGELMNYLHLELWLQHFSTRVPTALAA